MNIFRTIRSLFGFNPEVSQAPIDKLDTILLQKFEIEGKIEKAQSEFDQIDTELSLKIAACDKLIEKGVKEGGDNKKFLVDRLDRITNSHLELIKGLIDEKKGIERERIDLETQIITKAVEITSQLDDEDQVIVKGQLDVWKETGLIKGEEIDNQAKAITLVLGEIVKGGEGSRGGHVIGRTKSGKPIYDSFNHSAHKDFTDQDHYDAYEHHEKERKDKNEPAQREQAKKHLSAWSRKSSTDKSRDYQKDSIERKKFETVQRYKDKNINKSEADVWNETGIIKGEEVDSQARAITMAIEEIVKGGPGSGRRKLIGIRGKGTNQISYHKDIDSGKYYRDPHFGGHEDPNNYRYHQEIDEKDVPKRDHNTKIIQKSHEPIAIEIAGKGDVVYDSPVEGHYANVIVRRYFKEGENNVSKILFLKRASNKIIAPNQFCLPGGHIDEGETIEQAAIRELKEEANLDASYVYTIGKAKCDDGKWAFYLEAPGVQGDTMLLDGESVNAAWMSQEEWIEADLIFDLKEHLVAMETSSRKIEDIHDILKKSEEDEELEKGGMFHPEKPNHKYVRREGSPGNYTYYYDSPDTKERDGKKYREGLYSSNQHPEHDKETMEKIARNINAMDIEYEYIDGDRNRYNGWRDLDGKIRKVLSNTSEGQKKKLGEMVKPEKAKFFRLIEEDDIKKSIDIDNPFYYNDEEELIKGRAAADGEERTWGGKKYKKSGGKWMPVGSGKKRDGGESKRTQDGEKESHSQMKKMVSQHFDHSSPEETYNIAKKAHKKGIPHEHIESFISDLHSTGDEIGNRRAKQYAKKVVEKLKKTNSLSTKQLKEHVENTSTDQLKKVAENKEHPHNDAAKRELERRGGDDSKEKEQQAKRLQQQKDKLTDHLWDYVVADVDESKVVKITKQIKEAESLNDAIKAVAQATDFSPNQIKRIIEK